MMRKILITKKKGGILGCGIALTLLFVMLAWGGVASGAVIRDLDNLSQNPLAYLEKSTADEPLLSPQEQKRLNTEADLLYFAPWHRTEPRHTPEQVSWGFREYGKTPGYGKGGRPHPKEWIRKMAVNAHLDDFPQRIFPAVTVNHTDFRHLPTREPHSRYPKGPSLDNPFDNFQVSSAPAGMPVLVTLVSRDRKWFLTETSHLLGWVPATDIAAVDPEFMKSWENGRYVAIVRDKAAVTVGKRVLFKTPLGAIFPTTGGDTEQTWIWTAARDTEGKASLRKASVAKAAAADMPVPLTPRHVAGLASELAGEPYGWGGFYGRRDCSSLVRDIFTPLGLWLPRNSGDQAVAWKFISFKNLSSAEREALIIRQGAPWRTLLWMPGHIMLYIGVHNGKPLIFHNFWRIRTRDAAGKRGQIIIGRAAITTLHPGGELLNLDPPRADRPFGIEGMTLLGEPPENGTAPPEKKP